MKFYASGVYVVLNESNADISSFKRAKFCSLSNPAAKLPRPSPATKTFTLMHTATKVDERDTTLDNGSIRNLSKISKVTSLGDHFIFKSHSHETRSAIAWTHLAAFHQATVMRPHDFKAWLLQKVESHCIWINPPLKRWSTLLPGIRTIGKQLATVSHHMQLFSRSRSEGARK